MGLQSSRTGYLMLHMSMGVLIETRLALSGGNIATFAIWFAKL